ncbi:ankyrin repeat and protein kinase domain-containing protein 1-like [Diaphorina citri]|uniref:Ankyrin repeat and protein kinase domain-containing protein 1-like n=1 Tax=Diaphorina citri TaxID=121845 RepID=A0A3Q0JLU9_DIACI|nr:ankyrin repeat and protein kinase domain-containing protein 1-like [Diaphorina citri]
MKKEKAIKDAEKHRKKYEERLKKEREREKKQIKKVEKEYLGHKINEDTPIPTINGSKKNGYHHHQHEPQNQTFTQLVGGTMQRKPNSGVSVGVKKIIDRKLKNGGSHGKSTGGDVRHEPQNQTFTQLVGGTMQRKPNSGVSVGVKKIIDRKLKNGGSHGKSTGGDVRILYTSSECRLRIGGDPEKANYHFGQTALHVAAARGHMNCVTFLVGFEANLWALDHDLHTPMDLAALAGRKEIEKANYHFGQTALHVAAARGHMNCVTFLVGFEANLWALDHDLHTPMDLAALAGRKEIIEYLDKACTKQELVNKKKVDMKKAHSAS